MVAAVVVTFAVLVALSMPIVFALGLSGMLGLFLGNFSLQKLPSALVAGSQSWVLLAIPTFVFAGSLMERCGMSYALVNLARGLVGWVRGGLGMSVVLAEYFFSGISGSTIADVSAIGSMLTPPMLRAGYRPEHAASLVASATAMGILVPPAIFMIVLGPIMDTSVVAIFLGRLLPPALTPGCLMVVIFLLAVASIYQFLMGMLGVPALLGEVLRPLYPTPWLFLVAVSVLVMLFGMVLEGLPAAVVLIPVVFPISKQIGIHPVHFATVLTAAVGIGLFLPPIGVGLLMALRFADVSVGRHFRAYWPYLISLFVGLLLLILLPELTLFLPRRAGLIR